MKDNEIGANDIIPFSQKDTIIDIYIATVLYNKRQKVFSRSIATEIVSIKFYQYILDNFSPLNNKRFIAYAHTKIGENMLRRAKFKVRLMPDGNRQHKPLFVLDPGQVIAMKARYERICEALTILTKRTI